MTYVESQVEEDDEIADEEGNDLKMLRRKAKKADQLEKEVSEGAAAKRELAFVKAGIDTDSALGSLFFKAYDGELTKEAITEAFAALGGPSGEPESNVDEITAEERASTRERQNLGAGAAGDTGEAPETPVRGKGGGAERAGISVLDAGGSREDALATTFATLVGAGAAGDRSVIVTPSGEQ